MTLVGQDLNYIYSNQSSCKVSFRDALSDSAFPGIMMSSKRCKESDAIVYGNEDFCIKL